MRMLEFLDGLNGETEVLLTLSVILFSGFILTRLTNTLNMPKVSGYILAGILIGPCCLNFIPSSMLEGMSFVSDLALAFIAFGVGKFFKKEVLMRTGRKIVVITLSEALAAGVLVSHRHGHGSGQHYDDHQPVQGQGRVRGHASADCGAG